MTDVRLFVLVTAGTFAQVQLLASDAWAWQDYQLAFCALPGLAIVALRAIFDTIEFFSHPKR